MPIDFDTEITEITNNLKQIEGYLDCEKIIVGNIIKQIENGNSDENMIGYLKKLTDWFDESIENSQRNVDCTNYIYASGIADSLLTTSYWMRWMKAVDRDVKK